MLDTHMWAPVHKHINAHIHTYTYIRILVTSPIQVWPSCCFYVPSAASARNVKAARGSDLNRTYLLLEIENYWLSSQRLVLHWCSIKLYIINYNSFYLSLGAVRYKRISGKESRQLMCGDQQVFEWFRPWFPPAVRSVGHGLQVSRSGLDK